MRSRLPRTMASFFRTRAYKLGREGAELLVPSPANGSPVSGCCCNCKCWYTDMEHAGSYGTRHCVGGVTCNSRLWNGATPLDCAADHSLRTNAIKHACHVHNLDPHQGGERRLRTGPLA